jgi:hypothetical protein
LAAYEELGNMTTTATTEVPPLNVFEMNVHSQNGEDGVIREILRRLEITDDASRWCVEFGAWDGVYLSNTFALVEKGWNAVYIEGDADKYRDLLQTVATHPRIVPLNEFVSRNKNEANCLDGLLERTGIPLDFDLLSIDIDSYDLEIWESLRNYRPKIVVIEINSSVPPGIVWRHSPRTPENTFSATQNVAVQKGYTLVCHTGNCIYVRNDLVAKIELDARYIQYPELLFLFDSPWFSADLFREKTLSIIKFIPRPLRPVLRKFKFLRELKKGLSN